MASSRWVFGEHRCGCYVGEASVALDECLRGDVAVRLETVAVDDNGAGRHFKHVEGAVHGENRRIEYVDPVDFLGRHDAYRPRGCLLLYYRTQQVALSLGELLGVVEQRVGEVVGKYHSGGIYIAGKATASGFVAAGFADAQRMADCKR